ncbi:hypothetical protein CapIbe_002022 [Capra ibex]
MRFPEPREFPTGGTVAVGVPQLEGAGRCAGLGWGMAAKNAPFLVLCGSFRRPVLLRTAFQPGIRHLPDGLDPVHV